VLTFLVWGLWEFKVRRGARGGYIAKEDMEKLKTK
jgi:hypothetical protein